jgi:hypothetical protein
MLWLSNLAIYHYVKGNPDFYSENMHMPRFQLKVKKYNAEQQE